MRNRITFAFVAVLASALFVAGLFSLLLVRHAVLFDDCAGFCNDRARAHRFHYAA